ncbi:MAG: prepilin peptidase [Alphaproteobacteria bacterium CG_4_9_14_3_um_filter_47_13]|nr:MAG: prepilin peptidase [Alphaproteobacteria bacterium CG_4_9_14_3_um_filter_47_13]
MLDWIAFASLCCAFIMLVALSVIDLKTRLLPNEMVLGFATLGFIFHLTTLARFVSVEEIFLGGFIGFTTLFMIRAVANHIYKTDALGLGDIKLVGAAGLWLGPEAIMLAISAGAMAGLIHGLFVALKIAKKSKKRPDFSYLQIPAGPGFAIGFILVGIYKFWGFNPL